MRVLIADKLAARVVEAIERLGAEVRFLPDLGTGDLAEHVADVNVLVVRSTKVTQTTIDAASSLSMIVRAGAGVNTIDVAAASARGIYVTNCPGQNSAAVAELAIGLLIACDRRIVDAASDLRSGRWRKKEYGKARGLKGRTLGIIGLGQIGLAVARRARGLEMRVMGWSRSLTPSRAAELEIARAGDPLEIARESDAVTLHVAASPDTNGMIGAEFLAAMKPGAILINTSRGEVVDAQALAAAVRDRGLRVGLDVFDNEPRDADAPFDQRDLAALVTATPHVGASTDQAADAIADEVIRIIRLYRETGKPPNTVNMCDRSPATHSLVVRHFNRVGVLAGVLDLLREEGINVEEMDNTIFDGASAACCTLQLDSPPSERLIATLEAGEHIMQVTVEGRA